MGTNTQLLDHRWGGRSRVNRPAELRINNKVSTITTVRDASLTGAFVETHADPLLLSRVSVRPLWKPGVWLDVYVVRIEDAGVGLEWCDPDLDHLSILLGNRA